MKRLIKSYRRWKVRRALLLNARETLRRNDEVRTAVKRRVGLTTQRIILERVQRQLND